MAAEKRTPAELRTQEAPTSVEVDAHQNPNSIAPRERLSDLDFRVLALDETMPF